MVRDSKSLNKLPKFQKFKKNMYLFCYVGIHTSIHLHLAININMKEALVKRGYTLLYCISCNERGLCWLWG